jgi:HD-GYP domain-containing protein (c-di-GMP phosphodiesterase class II)
MKDKSRIYALALTAVASAVLYFSLPDIWGALLRDPRGIIIWFALLTAAGIFTFVTLKGGGGIIGTAVINFAVIITYGGGVAAWLGSVEMLFLTLALLRFGLLRSLFNMSQMAISLALAGLVYEAAGGTRLAVTWDLRLSLASILPLVLCHLTYFFTNTGLVTVWSGLRLRRSMLRTWKAGYLWMLPQSFAAPVVGVLLAYVFVRLSLVLVVLLFTWLIYYARTSKTNLELQNSQRDTVAALATAVDAGNPFPAGESERTAALALELGRRIGISGWRMQSLEYAALLHDIGYLSVGKSVLGKTGCLSPEEWEAVRRHAEVGAAIIGRVKALRRVSQIVSAHHERPDGRGYPQGLKSGRIPREAAILKVADAFVAMTTDRPYRPAMSPAEAVARIARGAGTQFEAGVVERLEDLSGSSILDRFAQPAMDRAA